MPTNLEDYITNLPEDEQREVAARVEVLEAQEMALSELRKARNLSQATLAEILGVGQPAISKIERKADLLISTLREYVEGLGGHIEIVAVLPGHPPVKLALLGDLAEAEEEG